MNKIWRNPYQKLHKERQGWYGLNDLENGTHFSQKDWSEH